LLHALRISLFNVMWFGLWPPVGRPLERLVQPMRASWFRVQQLQQLQQLQHLWQRGDNVGTVYCSSACSCTGATARGFSIEN
jgi:hypothetical protein